MKSMMEWAALVFWTNRKDYEHLSAAEQESITAEATKVQSGCSHFDGSTKLTAGKPAKHRGG